MCYANVNYRCVKESLNDIVQSRRIKNGKKSILFILFFLIFLTSFAQMKKDELQKKWKIDNILGFVNEFKGVDEYNIFAISKGEGFAYGNLIELNSDNTFHSYYTAPCGNDVFPETFGVYEVLDANHIHFRLDSAILLNAYSPQQDFNKKINVDLGTFVVDRTIEGFRLIKTVEGVQDDTRRVYAVTLNLVSKDIDKYTSLIWSGKLEPKDRNHNHQEVFFIGLKKSELIETDKSELLFTTEWYNYSINYLFKYKDEFYFVRYIPGSLEFEIFKVNWIDILE